MIKFTQNNMKQFIKLFEEFVSEVNETPGKKLDVQVIDTVMPIQYNELLDKIEKDWGGDSDLYYEVFDQLMVKNFKGIISILKSWDVYDTYKEYLNLNEDNTSESTDDTNALQVEVINAQNVQKAKTELSNQKIPYNVTVVNASTFFKFGNIPDLKKGETAINSVIDRKLEAAVVAPKQ